MRFSLAWLREHLEGATPADELAARLTSCGMNVELREPSGSDEAWDVDVTANRPDAMNHRGLAREAAAAGCGALRPLANDVVEGAENVGTLASITVEDPRGCPRYCARVVQRVGVGPSPAWLAERLVRCGIRPVNNVVDATNYVLLDVGQPLHAFDLARLVGHEVRVRRARAGETLTTLDGVARPLVPDDLVIADAARPVGLAGVMGGAESEIGAGTTSILIESAYFDPLTVRRMRRRVGLTTEASHRFERGADRAMARGAVDLAAALIARLAGGEVAAGVLDSAPLLPEQRTISFSVAGLAAFAGCPIPTAFVLQVLTELELRPRLGGDTVTCTVPSHRVDLELAEDLYEEILRHFGYDRVPSVLPPVTAGPGRRLGGWPRTERAREALLEVGAAEAITFSFVSAEAESATARSPLAARGGVLEVANPLSARMSVMRRSLLAGLLEAAAGNLRRGADRVALGEVGRVYFGSDGSVREEERLGLVLAGRVGPWDAERELDFYDLKGRVEAVVGLLAAGDVSWRPLAASGGTFAAGAAAELVLAGATIGIAGRISDDTGAILDLPAPAWAAELDLAVAKDTPDRSYRPLPRYPAIAADLTVRHSVALPYASLMREIRALSPEWLDEIHPVVRYQGEGVAPDEVKTTIRLVYRHPDRSLTQDEVNTVHFALMEALAARLGVSYT